MAINRLSSWLSRVISPAKQKPVKTVKLRAELLETRDAPATFTVGTDGASGTGPNPEGGLTLAAAIVLSNKTPGLNKIVFSLPVIVNTSTGIPEFARRAILVPSGGLPIITNPVIIDGTPQASQARLTNGKVNYGIGSSSVLNTLAKGTPGIVVDVGTVNNQTSAFNNFNVGKGDTIPLVWTKSATRVIPYSFAGGAGAIGGFPGSGVIVAPGARLVMTGGAADGNGGNTSPLTTYTQNNGLAGAAKITVTVYSPHDGIVIYSGSQNVGSNIGATGSKALNVGVEVAGNAGNGIYIAPETGQANDPSFNEVLQDTISGNGEDGVLIQDCSDNLVGDPVNPNGKNWIYLNVTNGVEVRSTTNAFHATRNRIQGNSFGQFPPPDVPPETTSTQSFNGQDGVLLYDAPNSLVGGTQTNAGNIIVNSLSNGIDVTGTGGSTGVVIQQNTIGTQLQPNLLDGVFIHDSAGVLVGGANTARNTIDWNDRNGVEFELSSDKGQVINNDISNNVRVGVLVNKSVSFTIGGPAANSGNNFNSDGSSGVEIDNQTNPTSPINTPTIIQGNVFTGDAADGNQTGIVSGSILINNSSNIAVGGTPPQAGNTINGSSNGIVIRSGSTNISVQGNKIGTTGSNSLDGVVVDGLPDPLFPGGGIGKDGIASNIQIGTIANGGANIIDASRNGVVVKNGAGDVAHGGVGVTIQANTISNNTQNGVFVYNDPVDALGNPVTAINSVTIGGQSNTLTKNVITSNARSGVYLASQYTENTIVQNNLIGVNKDGSNGGNGENGVEIDGASLNTIGGENALSRNIISFNVGNGVRLEDLNTLNPVPFGNVISGNSIGTDVTGTINEGNGGTGVLIDGGGSNTVGGYDPAATAQQNPGNIIAFNGRNGVTVYDTLGLGFAQNDAIIGNRMFNNADLAIDIGDDLGTVNLNQNPPYSGNGPNQFQNFPVLLAAQSGLVGSEITGNLTSTPGLYRLEFYGDPTANAGGSIAGYGQGQTYLGFENIMVGPSGTATFTFNTTVSVQGGTVVSATATNITSGLPGPTSEMALSIPVSIAVGQINGRVFNDLNATYTDLPGDPGLAGWVIDLYAGNDVNVDASTTTGANGAYSFGTLTDGTYTIKEVVQTGWVQTFLPTPDPMQITGGVTLTNVDFGDFQALSISGHKFNDLNDTGHNDPGDPGLAGIQFELWQIEANNTKLGLATVTSDLNGNFQFTNVAPTLQPVPAPSGTEINPIFANSANPGPITLQITEIVPVGWTLTTGNPPAFNITSGKNVTGLTWGDHKGGGGGGGGGGNVGGIIIVGTGAGTQATVLVYNASKSPTKPLYTIHPYGNFTGGVTVASGDVNGDGQDDIIVAPGPGLNSFFPGQGSLVKVYDGNTGKLIEQLLPYGSFNGGVFVASADVNGDGFGDIVTGPMAGGGPNVKVFDGLTGIVLFNFNAYAANYTGGVRVAAGDVNGDGFADIITAPGAGIAPLIEEWSGATYGTGTTQLLRSFYGFTPTNTGGAFVAAELNQGSVFANVIVGTGSGAPTVYTYDGPTGNKLSSFQVGPAAGNPSQILGSTSWTTGVHVGAVSFDGTGNDDVLTGSSNLRPNNVRGYNALTGKLLLNLTPFNSSFLGGVWVAGGDV